MVKWLRAGAVPDNVGSPHNSRLHHFKYREIRYKELELPPFTYRVFLGCKVVLIPRLPGRKICVFQGIDRRVMGFNLRGRSLTCKLTAAAVGKREKLNGIPRELR